MQQNDETIKDQLNDDAKKVTSEVNINPKSPAQPPGEVGGAKGPEPTRYGDWEKGGRCTDF